MYRLSTSSGPCHSKISRTIHARLMSHLSNLRKVSEILSASRCSFKDPKLLIEVWRRVQHKFLQVTMEVQEHGHLSSSRSLADQAIVDADMTAAHRGNYQAD